MKLPALRRTRHPLVLHGRPPRTTEVVVSRSPPQSASSFAGQFKALKFRVRLSASLKLLFLSPFLFLSPPPPCDLTQASAGVLVTFQPSGLSMPSLTAGGFCLNMVSGMADTYTCTSCTREGEKKKTKKKRRQNQRAAERNVVKYSSSASSTLGDVLCASEHMKQ